MATATADVQPRRKTITTTVEVDTNEARAEEFYRGDFWEIIQRIQNEKEKRTPWLDHIVRVYRVSDDGKTESVPEDNKFVEPFNVDSLRERFGGGRFKIWLYGPPNAAKLVYPPFIVSIEGPSKFANGTAGSVRTTSGHPMSTTDLLIQELLTEIRQSRGSGTLAESMKTAMQLNAQALQMGVEGAKAVIAPAPAAAAQPDEMTMLMRDFMKAMLIKMMNPPETNHFKDTLSLINEIKTAGLFGTAPKQDWGSMLVANLPMVVDRAVSGLHEYRLSAESTERALRIQAGQVDPRDPKVITVEPGVPAAAPANGAPAPATPAAPPAQTFTPEVISNVIFQADLERLVDKIKHPDCTGADIYDYLFQVQPAILEAMGQYSKEQLLMFFGSAEMQQQQFGRAIFVPIAKDPRLPGMIEEFLKICKENSAPEAPKTATV